jgi:hypothetical protein
MATLQITIAGPTASANQAVGLALVKQLQEAGRRVVFLSDDYPLEIDGLPPSEVLDKALELKAPRRENCLDVVITTEIT